MWHQPPEDLSLPDQIPIFPLPNLVFFPGTVVPLHIFEPRYRQMIQDVLAGDGVLALSLLKPGWEARYHDNPPIHPVGCAGRLLEVASMPEGRFNIRLAGLGRVRLDEYETHRPYRMARAELLPELLPADGCAEMREARNDLLGAYGLLVAEITGCQSLALEGARSAPFHALVNTLSAHLDLPSVIKQELLNEDNVLERSQAVTHVLRLELERLSQRKDGSGPGTPTVH
jgi:hypothetical protein